MFECHFFPPGCASDYLLVLYYQVHHMAKTMWTPCVQILKCIFGLSLCSWVGLGPVTLLLILIQKTASNLFAIIGLSEFPFSINCQ